MSKKVFLAQYQIHRPSAGGAGPRDVMRKPMEEVLVVAESPEAIPAVITRNTQLAEGEQVDVVQQGELKAGKKVFL